MSKRKNFRITGGRGFHIQLANGYVASVQFGGGHYCENYDRSVMFGTRGEEVSSDDAEMAFFTPSGVWYHPACLDSSGDDVYPRLSPTDLLAVLNEMSGLPAEVVV